MKSSKIKIAAVLSAASFMLAGCGDALYALTPEEESAVISYASHVVAKYNTFQQDGEIFVMQQVLDGEDTEDTEGVGAEQEELPKEEQNEQENPSDTQISPDGQQELPSSDVSQSTGDTLSLGAALELSDIQADYEGNSLYTTYKRSDSFAVDASPGKQLLVLSVNLKNQTGQDVHIDVLKMTPSFQVTVNETETAVSQTTILPDDLSTYQGDISAGGTEETVLLFQISQEIEEIESLQLKVTVNGAAHTVDL